MLKRKGFTLLEVVLALGFVGILVTFVVSATAGQYGALIKTKNISEHNAKIVKSLETNVKRVKTDIENNSNTEPQVELTLFSGVDQCKIILYKVEEELEDRELTTFVADTRLPGLTTSFIVERKLIPSIENVVKDKLKYAYLSPTLKLRSEFKVEDPQSVHYTTKYQWFVSREGFQIVNYDDEDESEGVKPFFPDDFILIPGETGTSLSKIKEEYKGRYLTVAATPFTLFGKMGERKATREFYVLGLPETETKLDLHLDASIIDLEQDPDPEFFNEETAMDSVTQRIDLMKWFDVENRTKILKPNGAATLPEVKRQVFGEAVSGKTKNKIYASYVSMTDGVSLSMPFKGNLNESGEATVFVVVRATSDNTPFLYQNAGGSAIGWSIALNHIKVGSDVEMEINGIEVDKWQLIGIRWDQFEDDPDSNIRVSVNGSEVINEDIEDCYNTLPLDGTLRLGEGSKADVAEVILYDGALSDEDYNNVESYLKAKYFR